MNRQNLKCYIDFVSFAALDCAMFLDTHPKNAEGLEYFEYYSLLEPFAAGYYEVGQKEKARNMLSKLVKKQQD